MKEISIIGLGGIGSILVGVLSRFESFSEGSESQINLVDGDDYEVKNLERQEFSSVGGNKATTKRDELQSKFRNVTFKSLPIYINESNVKYIVKENSTVFVCVDNHKTRKIVSDAAESLSDVTIISGGNELVDGNVQIFIKKGGIKVTPGLTDYHPEIKNPLDKLPNEMSCEELSHSEPQLLFTNLTVATCMTWAYYNILKGNDLSGSEIYFDISKMKLDSKDRKVKQ